MAGLQDLFVPLGFTREAALELDKQVVNLAVHVASFQNKLDEEVLTAFQSALVGNHETVRKYGIMIDELSLKQAALDKGWTKNFASMTAQEKAMLRLKIMTDMSKDAMGDAIRTAGSFANQLKRLVANLTNISEILGKLLLPGVTNRLTKINKWLSDNEAAMEKWGITVMGRLSAVKDIIGEFLSAGTVWQQKWAALWDGMLKIMKGALHAAFIMAVGTSRAIWQVIMNPAKGGIEAFEKAGGKVFTKYELWDEAKRLGYVSPRKRDYEAERKFKEETFFKVKGRFGFGERYIRRIDRPEFERKWLEAQEKEHFPIMGPASKKSMKAFIEGLKEAGLSIGELRVEAKKPITLGEWVIERAPEIEAFVKKTFERLRKAAKRFGIEIQVTEVIDRAEQTEFAPKKIQVTEVIDRVEQTEFVPKKIQVTEVIERPKPTTLGEAFRQIWAKSTLDIEKQHAEVDKKKAATAAALAAAEAKKLEINEKQLQIKKEIFEMEQITAESMKRFALLSEADQARAIELMKKLKREGPSAIGELTAPEKELIKRVGILSEFAGKALEEATRKALERVLTDIEVEQAKRDIAKQVFEETTAPEPVTVKRLERPEPVEIKIDLSDYAKRFFEIITSLRQRTVEGTQAAVSVGGP